jgi:hypothetical protein
MTGPDQTPTDQPTWQPPLGNPTPNGNGHPELAYGLRQPSEEVARELHANGVHTKCPADCLARWDAAGNDVIAGYNPAAYGSPGAPVAPQPGPSLFRRRPLLLGAAALALVAGLVVAGVAVFGGFGGPDEHPMTIRFGLFDATGDGGNCSDGGSGGYSDINPGTPVTVKDETGKIVASTELPDTGKDNGESTGCIWTMHVTVPTDAKQYAVEVGRRGAVTYSHDKLVAAHWTTETSLGG